MAQKQRERVAALQKEVEELEQTLGYASRLGFPVLPYPDTLFRGGLDPEKIVSKHIKLLHRYNEAKDATQVSRRVYQLWNSRSFDRLLGHKILVGKVRTCRATHRILLNAGVACRT